MVVVAVTDDGDHLDITVIQTTMSKVINVVFIFMEPSPRACCHPDNHLLRVRHSPATVDQPRF